MQKNNYLSIQHGNNKCNERPDPVPVLRPVNRGASWKAHKFRAVLVRSPLPFTKLQHTCSFPFASASVCRSGMRFTQPLPACLPTCPSQRFCVCWRGCWLDRLLSLLVALLADPVWYGRPSVRWVASRNCPVMTTSAIPLAGHALRSFQERMPAS